MDSKLIFVNRIEELLLLQLKRKKIHCLSWNNRTGSLILLLTRILIILFSVFPLLLCSNNPVYEATSKNSARIYMPDGQEPAEGAIITIYNAGLLNNDPVYLDLTDESGRYSLESLSPGYYGIWAQKDSLVLFMDSIRVSADQTKIRDDTLEYPSSLNGKIVVDFPHISGLVTIGLASSAKKCTMTDTGGLFNFCGLAEGFYVLIVESTMPGYSHVYKNIRVRLHSQDTIIDPIRCEYNGISYIKNIITIQDTLKGTVKIIWNKSLCPTIQDYLLYRDAGQVIDLSKDPVCATRDTSFVDSFFSSLDVNMNDSSLLNCKYRVAIRTINQEIGPTNGYIEVSVAPKSMVTTFFKKTVQYRGKKCDSVSIGDKVTFKLVAKNSTRALKELIWCDSMAGDTVSIVRYDSLNTNIINDSLCYSFPDTGFHIIKAIVIDRSGTKWFCDMTIKNIRDTLAALAGNDTGVFIGKKFYLHGDAIDHFGEISRWKWKIGSGKWIETSGPDTIIEAPSLEELMVCSLEVTDEDSIIRKDEIQIISSLPVTMCAVNSEHSLFLKSDGGLWASGNNEFGQLGDGTLRNRSFPVRIMGDVQSMAAGSYHTLIIKKEGTLWACGDNSNGQFGDGTLEGHATPNRIMDNVQKVAANSNYSLILKNDGTLLACGWNTEYYESSSENDLLPIVLMTDVKSMSAGTEHILILKNDETLWSCGKNHYGQLGDGTKVDRFVPAQIMSGVKSIDANGMYSMILKNDGTLWTCGLNYSAQLGYYGYSGSTRSRSTPVQIMADVKSVAAGWYHSLIIKIDGTLWATGYNSSYGYMGQFGVYSNHFSPIQVMDSVKQASAGWNYSMIVRTDGTLWACGENLSGQFGNGEKVFVPEPIRVIPYQYYGMPIEKLLNNNK